MSEVETEVIQAVIDPAIDIPIDEPEYPEQSYSYQPTDDAGRPMGGKQVLKYRTQDELVQKMQEQNTLLIRKLREETRKNRLGIVEKEVLPEELPRYVAPTAYNQRQLSPDERVQLSRDLLDPERSEEAYDTFFESRVGVKPETLRQQLVRQQEDIYNFKAGQETDAFVALNPSYYRCQENFEAITNWMVKNELAPVRQNFQKAFDELRRTDHIINGPAPVAPVAPVEAPIEPVATAVVPAVEPEARPVAVARIPSGLTRGQAADGGTAPKIGDDIVYEILTPGLPTKVLRGLAAVNAMPAEEYKRRLQHDRGFSRKIEKLEEQATAARARRMQERYQQQ